MKKYLKFVWTFFVLISVANLYAAGSEVREVAPGVYAGESITQAGEKIYFGMERIDASNKAVWENYPGSMLRYGVSGNGSRGTLNYLTIYSNPAKRSTIDIADKDLLQYTGMNPDELNQYLDMLASKKAYEVKMREEMKNIGGGEAGFAITVSTPENPYYVVYASKKPVTGPYTAPQPNNLKEFIASYGDIIMSVGSWHTANKDFYQNRGIFRNPLSVVDGGYKNISLQLHGFSAAVNKKFFPQRTMFIVYALPSMASILEKNLKPGEGYFGEKNIPPELQKNIPASKGFGALDIPIIIKTEVLANFYER